jgi:hypothetical protein
MGLNAFAHFVGFGLGSFGFGALLEFGFFPPFGVRDHGGGPRRVGDRPVPNEAAAARIHKLSRQG